MTTCADTSKRLDEFQDDEFAERIRALAPQAAPQGFLGRLRARLAAERPGLDQRDTAPLAWRAADTSVGEPPPLHAPSPLRVAA